MDYGEGTLDECIDVHWLHLAGVFFEHRSDSENNVSGATSLFGNVFEDFPHFPRLGAAAVQEPLSSLRIAQDSRQWLVEFVRDRTRQFAEGR